MKSKMSTGLMAIAMKRQMICERLSRWIGSSGVCR
jgi:hypothetical protein